MYNQKTLEKYKFLSNFYYKKYNINKKFNIRS